MPDFRSDTVTQPTPEMRAAMLSAVVGDDVFNEDPSVHALQECVASLLGHEAALFVPSGTMANQIAVRLHCNPGDEILCEADCHVYYYEQGGYSQLAGAAIRPVQGRFGVLELEQLVGLVRPDDAHFPHTRLVTIENTHNRGAGRVQPYEKVTSICDWAHLQGLRTHMDGARLMNAVVASGIAADQWARHFDTVSICFSKGLGAPIGSALVGSAELIRAARRHRKLLGGGMRQAGVIAAAALYALEHHVDRLAEDHANAKLLGEAITRIDGLTLSPDVQTNIVTFEVASQLGTAEEFVKRLRARGVLMSTMSPTRIRAVTHLDVTRTDVQKAADILAETAETQATAS